MYIVIVLFLSDFTYVNKAEEIVTFCFIYILQSVQTFLKSGLKKIQKNVCLRRLWSELTHWRSRQILISFHSTRVAVCRTNVACIRRRTLSWHFLSIFIPDVGSSTRQKTTADTLELWPCTGFNFALWWIVFVHLETWKWKETKRYL